MITSRVDEWTTESPLKKTLNCLGKVGAAGRNAGSVRLVQANRPDSGSAAMLRGNQARSGQSLRTRKIFIESPVPQRLAKGTRFGKRKFQSGARKTSLTFSTQDEIVRAARLRLSRTLG